ncbi:MAG TPA: alpha/beta fold hydrolase, partial [Actinomycetota bacterium]|nr:alpha/beta fold hydrolase [Actinomycetota bacterium]
MPLADLGDVQLYYKDHGDPAAPAALGVMGFALDQRYWAAQIPAVTATHRFVTFDNRGVGRSTGDASVSLETMADDAVRLLDHLGIEKAVIFGMSMGGTIAQHVVLAHPDRVTALILGVTWARPLEFMRRQDDVGPRASTSTRPTSSCRRMNS